ncbi:MAG: flagellar hook-associated protein FlgK [Phycisphaeraceae bacterium]|nr:flagellar hook-associated protein FlgK [Phycisphaeraceae bacterium]
MSLTAAIQIGHSALTASQVGLQVAGNNMANAATPGYTRQIAALAPQAGQRFGNVFLGRGVGVHDVRRQIDEALQSRLRAGISDASAARQRLDIAGAVEATLNELSGNDLSSQFSAFFNSWSELANLTQGSAVVVQTGAALASFMRRTRDDLTTLRSQIDNQVGAMILRADELLRRVAGLNRQIVTSELGSSENGALRDQRDEALSSLAELFDIATVEQADGSVDVLIGSTPVVLGSTSKDLSVRRVTENGRLDIKVLAGRDERELAISSGAIGALLSDRAASINATIDHLDTLASRLIHEVNRLHSVASPEGGMHSAVGFHAVASADRSRAFNDPANTAFSGLPFSVVSGGFYLHVRHPASGDEQIVRINIDLDGIDASGLPGTHHDTSLDDLIAALDAVGGINAAMTPDGRLSITAAEGFTFSFADDTSGVLAVLGVNAYFTGTSAADIAVSDLLLADPSRLHAGRLVEGQFVANSAAIGISGLQDRALESLNGRSLRQAWQDRVQSLAVEAEAAAGRAHSADLVQQSLFAQRAAVSGVSIDEESLNLMNFQRQYQGAARLISIADELLKTLMSII